MNALNFLYLLMKAVPPPSGGVNPPLDTPEKKLAKVLIPIFKQQAAETKARVSTGEKKNAVTADDKKWDKAVIAAVRPIWYEQFKQGGDDGLGEIRKAPKKKAKPANLPGKIVLPEWVTDPAVIDAIERELFVFAHQINSTSADILRRHLVEGMEAGESIHTLANRIAEIEESWEDGKRAEMIARTETARAYSVGKVEAWGATGVVTRKIWHAAGDACPFCLAMNGKQVGVAESFFKEGDSMKVKWRGQSLSMNFGYSDVIGPPLHPNCRCVLIAELSEKAFVAKGGEGSGNFGHEGRPGEVGGSGEGGGAGGTSGKEITGSAIREKFLS